jgi:ABC-type transporter Mla subunit MlaD
MNASRQPEVQEKVDALSTSVEARFDDVTLALAEQQQYTEFAFDRLCNEMTAGFGGVVRRFSDMNGRFSGLTDHIGRLERKIDQVIDRLTRSDS